jgi:ubiquinone/menaquinone biosynthesis C-methylase UbiE
MYADGKTEVISDMIKERMDRPVRRLLVTGCGTGIEAAILAQRLEAHVIGIDQPEFGTTLNLDPQFAGMDGVKLQVGDAENLSFEDASFDFVYSFHAIEHFAHYKAALSELKRVLRPGGGCFIGTPNKHRLFAYFGAKEGKLTFGQKITRNLTDYKHRLQGRFENELGAHAGFYAEALGPELTRLLGHSEDVTNEYFLRKFSGQTRLVRTVIATGASRYLFPSISFFGKKTAT